MAEEGHIGSRKTGTRDSRSADGSAGPLERTLLSQQRAIALNHRIANVFLTAPTPRIYADVLDVVLEFLDSEFGYFGYINDDGDLVCPSMTRHVWSQCQVPDKSIVFPREDWGGLWGRSLVEKRTVISNQGLRLPEGHVPLRNAMAVPILYRDELIGQFAVADKPDGYQDEDRELLQSAAAQTGPVLWALREQARQRQLHERLEKQYRQAQKMEAIGQLTGGVAHDFNNLLQVINGGTEMALLDLDSGHPARRTLGQVAEAGRRAARLVQQLLLFSRRQIMRPADLDLNGVVSDVLEMLDRVIGEHIGLDWDPGARTDTIHADRSMVEQVLMNLCVNARDAMAEGGTLTVQTREVLLGEAFCEIRPGARPGSYVLLSVSDTGSGMDPETLDQAFEPFFSTKERGKGTGLGLATVYGIVRQHGGLLDVHSEPGEGTTFQIYWPAVASSAEGEEMDAQAPPAGGDETILLVEDDGMVRRLGRNILVRAGYTVLTAREGAEALALVEDRDGNVDLAVLDVVLPDMGGRKVHEKIQARWPGVKALFASGYSENAIHTNFVLDRGLNLLQKPFTRHALLLSVREILDREAE
jgi:signal transduction histidine kinase/ActR/RegA family two-component response regulator